MRTDELRTLLHERGDEVHDHGASARLDAVHGRVVRARRRRAAAAGGGLVAAVVAVALVVVPGLRGPQAPVAGDDRPSGGYSKDGVTFPEQVRGRKLLGAVVGDPGQSLVYLIADGPDSVRDVEVSPVCYGPHADRYAVSVSIDDVMVYGMSCGKERPVDPTAAGTSSGAELADALRGLGLSQSRNMDVRVWLRPRDMRDSEPVMDPEMVVGVGVYGHPSRPDIEVDNPHEITFDGRRWELSGVQQVGPGERLLGVRAGASRKPTVLALGTRGLNGPVRYSYSVDGRVVGTGTLGGASGADWTVVGTLEPGATHEVLVEITRGSMAEAGLSLARYHAVD